MGKEKRFYKKVHLKKKIFSFLSLLCLQF